MEGIANFIIPMLKNQAVNTKGHLFYLNKLKSSRTEPLFQLNLQQQSSNGPAALMAPRFNQDRLHFTPAFLLPCDQTFCRQNVSFERLRFQEKIQNAQEKSIIQPEDASIPNPFKLSPPSNFCQLCKAHYSDYLSHIQQSQHRQLQDNSPANRYIEELAGQFQRKKGRKRLIAKGRQRRGRPIVRKGEASVHGGGEGRECQKGSTSLKSSNVSTKLSSEML